METNKMENIMDNVSAPKAQVLNVSGSSSLSIRVSGDATSHTLNFLGSIDGGQEYSPIAMVALDDFAVETGTSDKDKILTTDVSALTHFKLDLTAVAGGGITVFVHLKG